MDDCIFCKIINEKTDRQFEYQDDKVVAFNDINPGAKVHILVVPRKHTATFMDLDGVTSDLIGATQKIIKEKGIEDGYRVIINGGKYQQVPHVHIHLMAGDLK